MLIKFNTDCEIEVIHHFDEELDEITDSTVTTFHAGDEVDIDILSRPTKPGDENDYVNVQFDDGSVAYGVLTRWFDEIPWYNIPGAKVPDNLTDKEWDYLTNPTKGQEDA